MTPTSKELLEYRSFLWDRVKQQNEYILNYIKSEHTRPDWKDVIESAEAMLTWYLEVYFKIATMCIEIEKLPTPWDLRAQAKKIDPLI